MPVFVHPIETAVPEAYYSQEQTRDLMRPALNGNGKMERVLHRVYSQSGIEKRHTVIPDFNGNGEASLFWDDSGSALEQQPGTQRRNDLYIKYARPMFSEVARKALERSPFEPGQVTHVITVSCTGFFAPGPEYYVVRDLGLPTSAQRYHIGFMGCYAAFPALRMADSICRADPDAVVLIAAVELCSLHLQFREDMDGILSNSVFADGGAGMVVSAAKEGPLRIRRLMTDLTEEGESDMAWELGDQGFNMVLSSYVPKIIQSNIRKLIDTQLQDCGVGVEDIHQWAMHPGGRSILDKIQHALDLSDSDFTHSRNTLKNYGNMSSATVLFVMKEIMENRSAEDKLMMAMAFGPGLTVESGLFELAEG